jgi:hypothetical protein
MSQLDIPSPQTVLDYIRRLGVRRSLVRGAYVAVNQLVSLSVFDCIRMGPENINKALTEIPNGYECRFLKPGEAGRFEGQLTGIAAKNLRHAVAQDDDIYVVLDGDRVANIGYYGAGPTPVQDNLVIHFLPPSRYMYGGYTTAAYRGGRLHALGILRAAQDLFDRQVPHLVSVCERTNYRAAVSVFRMGWQPHGLLYHVGIGSRNWIGRTAAGRNLGMELRWQSPERHERA